MSREELIGKIFQQKEKRNNFHDEIGRVQRQFKKDVANSGVTLNTCQSVSGNERCYGGMHRCQFIPTTFLVQAV
jgi:hypothetical protein